MGPANRLKYLQEISFLDTGGKHIFIADHVVDGRILMPATSYVVTAWEALASEMGVEARQLPATLQDVRIHQAVVATEGQKITLEVQLAPGNRFFVRLLFWIRAKCGNHCSPNALLFTMDLTVYTA